MGREHEMGRLVGLWDWSVTIVPDEQPSMDELGVTLAMYIIGGMRKDTCRLVGVGRPKMDMAAMEAVVGKPPREPRKID